MDLPLKLTPMAEYACGILHWLGNRTYRRKDKSREFGIRDLNRLGN